MSGWLWPAMASLFAGMAVIMLVVGLPILPWHHNSAQRSSSSGETSSHSGAPGETSRLQCFALQAHVIGWAACARHPPAGLPGCMRWGHQGPNLKAGRLACGPQQTCRNLFWVQRAGNSLSDERQHAVLAALSFFF